MKISEMSNAERPRERLLSCGPESLSSSELIAVLLGSGTVGCSALELGQKLMSMADGALLKLYRMPLETLRTVKGLGGGGTKVLHLVAAFELGRRFMVESSSFDKTPIISPAQIYNMMIPPLKGLMHEETWVILLNRANCVIHKQRMTTGGLSATIIDVKSVVALALEKKASGIVVVHNHPSANPRPGAEDIKQTAMLKQAAGAFDIRIVDHVVVCDDSYYSFADDAVVSAKAPCADVP